MHKTVVCAVNTWNFTKTDSRKILLLTAAFHSFLKINRIYQKTPILESLCNKVTAPAWIFITKRPGTDVFFCEIFKKHLFYTTLPGDYFWFVQPLLKNDIKMTIIEAIIVTLMLEVNVFLSFAITFEAAIQNNLIKSWRFSREMTLVEFCYNIKLV